MKNNRIGRRIFTVLLIISFINLIVGCVYYAPTLIPIDSRIPAGPTKQYDVYQGGNVWTLNQVNVIDNELRGTIINTGFVTTINDIKKSGSNKNLKQIVNLYVDPTFTLEFEELGSLKIPFTAIEKIEVYDVDIKKTVLVTAGGIAATLSALVLIILLTKESCPFVYVFNGDSFEFTGEIYSGAIHPPLERHDYLSLPSLAPIDNEYRVKVTNEVREIQHTNLAELLVFDHPENTKVLVDKYGREHTIIEPQIPQQSTSIRGDNVETFLSNQDGVSYMSGIPDDDELMDGVILTFDRPDGADIGKLLIRGKNTFWLDYIHGQFSELFGEKLGEWREKQKSGSPEKFMKWSLDQGIPLSVYLETEGGWEFVDYFNVIGPIAARDDVLAIDLSQVTTDEVRIKLEFGFLFWEIDYAAMDFAPNIKVRQTSLSATAAIDQSGRDVSNLLLHDDGLYYHQPNIGDEVLLTFEVPQKEDGIVRTAILHSKGHYETLRNPTGVPDSDYLQGFKEPGAFVQFSKEQFLNLYNRISN